MLDNFLLPNNRLIEVSIHLFYIRYFDQQYHKVSTIQFKYRNQELNIFSINIVIEILTFPKLD